MSKPCGKSDNCWLPPWNVSLLHGWGYLARILIVMAHRFYSWVELLISFPSWHLAQNPQILWASPLREGFRVSSSCVHSSPVSKVYGVFSNRILPLGSGRQQKVMTMDYIILGVPWGHWLHCYRSSFDSPDYLFTGKWREFKAITVSEVILTWKDKNCIFPYICPYSHEFFNVNI